MGVLSFVSPIHVLSCRELMTSDRFFMVPSTKTELVAAGFVAPLPHANVFQCRRHFISVGFELSGMST